MFKRTRLLSPDEVEALSPDTDADKLRQLIKEGSSDVQAAALRRLADLNLAVDQWLQAHTGSTVAPEVVAAAETILQSQPVDALDAALKGRSERDSYALLCHCRPEATLAWLSNQPEETRLDLALHANRASDRQQAAEALDAVSSLQTVQRSAKGHDKALYKMAKTRLQHLREATAEQQEHEAALAHIIQGLEKLARISTDPLLEGRFLHLQRRLEALNLTSEERALVTPLVDQVTAHLAEIEAEKRAQAIARETVSPSPELDQPATEAAAEEASGQAAEPAAEPAMGDAIPEAPEPEPAPPTLSPEEQTRQDAEKAEAKAAEAEINRQVQEVRVLLRRGHGALKGGHLRQARGIWRTAQDALAKLDPERHRGLVEDAEQYHEALEKLADWQDFAVLPKKQELMEHMRLLAERSMHPQDKADAVQVLQKEWQALSQGGGGKHQDLWEEFHALAEAAYAPCKDYFAEQAELQAVNAVKRRELIEQLELYVQTNDWQNPDWAEVEKVLRLAADEWRHFSPVKPREHRATEKDYRAAVSAIREKLHVEYDRNREVRERIIADAEALRDEENLRTATENLKALQRAWKEAGRTHRKDDQRLWQAFRAICDELFARRDEQSEAFKSELDQHVIEAIAIIEQIEAAAASEDPAQQTNALQQLPQWRHDFDACAPLPKARVTDTQQRFNKAVDALQGAKQARQQSQQRAAWQALFERAGQLGTLEAAMFEGQFDTTLKQKVEALREDGTSLPAVGNALDDRWAATQQAFEAGQAAPEAVGADAYRRQAVLLEILMEADSPEEDRPLRLQLQVERLADGLGQQPDRRSVERVLAEWLQLAVGMTDAEFQSLHARVETACMEYFIK